MIRRLMVVAVMTATGLAGSGRALALSSPSPGLQVEYLGQLRPEGLPAGISFGGGGNVFERRVDVSGSLAVVGAGVFRQGDDKGYAFVYDLSDPNDIRQIAKLRASDNSAGNEYGDGVAISGNYVFVTAWGDSENRGAVYMYDVSDPDNIIERKITARDGASYHGFGYSLAVDGTKLLVGAPKFYAGVFHPAAYLIDFADPNHLRQWKIDPGLPGLGNGYGQSVAISGDYAIVSRSSDSTAFPFAGSAYLYDISNPDAIRSQRLRPTDAPNYDGFGDRVSISGNKAVVSVDSDPGPTNNAGTRDGAVWAFDFSDWNNIKQHEFGRPTPVFSGPSPPLGRWLELQANLAVAAAFGEDNSRGALYFYDVSNVSAPRELLRLPSPSPSDQFFGVSLALDGRTMIVSDHIGNVYAYRIVPEPAGVTLAAIALTAFALRRRHPVAHRG